MAPQPAHPAGSAVPSRAAGAVMAQYGRIRSELLAGVYPPGTLLLETSLSRLYEVSRTPVREALGLLAQDGILTRTRRGFVVRTRTVQEILDLYDARIALESTVAALAAERRTDVEVLRLEEIGQRRRHAESQDEIAETNRQWHQAVRAASHNEAISALLDQVGTQLAIYRPAFTMRTDRNREVVEHDRVTEAIRDKDGEAARLAMITHLEVGRELRVEALLDDLA